MAGPQRGHQAHDPRATVRIAQFERTLENFNREQGMKVAFSLVQFHKDYMEPYQERIDAVVNTLESEVERLAARVAYLELPFYKRAWIRFSAFMDRLVDAVTETYEPATTLEVVCGPAADTSAVIAWTEDQDPTNFEPTAAPPIDEVVVYDADNPPFGKPCPECGHNAACAPTCETGMYPRDRKPLIEVVPR